MNQKSNEAQDLAPVVGENVRRLRSGRDLSLEKLAQLSGVSRAMLSQIELGQSAPTINILWKIARALDVTFSTLIASRDAVKTVVMRQAQARRLSSSDGSFTSRALFPVDHPRRVEFYELRLTANARENADSHPPGTFENLFVAKGAIDIEVEGERHSLEVGDAIQFEATGPHAYVNRGKSEAVMYLVMTYAETVS